MFRISNDWLRVALLTIGLASASGFAANPCVAQSCAGGCGGCSMADSCTAPLGLAPEYGGCLCCRSKLTGDWWGRRTCYAERGITFDFDETLFYYGVVDGGLEQDWGFSGHGDYVVNFDMNKLAGREGLFVKLRAEHRYGDTINGSTGSFLPATISPVLPTPDSNEIFLTNLVITQALSENFAVFAGKIDTFDGDANAFAHGRGKTQFSNMAFVANPALLRTVPYSTLAAGFIVLQDMEPVFTFTVLNATDTTTTSGFDELFANGVTLNAEARLPTCFFGLPGHQLLGGSWSSREYVELGQDPRVVFPNVPITQQAGSWSIYWNFDQHLVVYADSPTQGWGVFGRSAIAEDHANPLQWFLSFGIGGNSPICCRQQDTFGIGWYMAGTSSQIGPLLEAALGPIGDGQGVELFYNYQVTPWLHLTPDLQILDSAREEVDTAVVAGLRGQIIW